MKTKTILTYKHLFQVIFLIASILLIIEGLWGDVYAPKNLTTLFVWIHYRGLLVLALLLLGNYFCMSCPFIFVRNLLRVFHAPKLLWPKKLQNKWAGIFLFICFLFSYEYFSLWSSPAITAWIIIGYFILALIIDLTFKKASFCKYLCPIGQFNFLSSTLSPTTVKAKNISICESCTTYECLNGVKKKSVLTKRGCETFLFIPKKTGNLDCTFCMDCADACPYDNVTIATVTPGEELTEDFKRAGVGSLSNRFDLQFFIIIFTFGGLLNAFAMTSPAQTIKTFLGTHLLMTHSFLYLLSLFILFLVGLPFILISRKDAHLIPTLLPMGFFIWLSHYSFHFLTGLFTFIPLIPSLKGATHFMGFPLSIVTPIQYGFLFLGFLGSLTLVWTREATSKKRIRWAITHVVLFLLSLWIMTQPMEMRGTFTKSAPLETICIS